VSPRNSSRGNDNGSKNSSSPKANSPLRNESIQQSLSNTPNLNPNPMENGVDIKGGLDESGNKMGPPLTASRGGRTTAESMPKREPSFGFRDGGQSGITMIQEEAAGT
jgi:hypothetical protein